MPKEDFSELSRKGKNMDALKMRKELSKVKGLGDVTINRIMEHFEKTNLLTPATQYAFSFDDEYYNGVYDSIEKAIEDAKRADEKEEEVYVGIVVKPKLRWSSNVRNVKQCFGF